MQRLGKNQGGYHGETIDIDAVLHDDWQAANRFGWRRERLPTASKLELLAFQRAVSAPHKRVYISTGIHGDEPAGPLAVRQLLQANQWPANAELWVCPCLNPTGFPINCRENANGVDLNRQYHAPDTEEICAHVAWLNRQPRFDLTLCLHEDWEAQGFYLYELNPEQRPSHAHAIISAVAKVCPIDPSAKIEGREAHRGIIRPDVDPLARPQWP